MQQWHVVNGKPPVLALVVDVTEAFMHCSKSFVRSKLWQREKWPDRANVPTLADWVGFARSRTRRRSRLLPGSRR